MAPRDTAQMGGGGGARGGDPPTVDPLLTRHGPAIDAPSIGHRRAIDPPSTCHRPAIDPPSTASRWRVDGGSIADGLMAVDGGRVNGGSIAQKRRPSKMGADRHREPRVCCIGCLVVILESENPIFERENLLFFCYISKKYISKTLRACQKDACAKHLAARIRP